MKELIEFKPIILLALENLKLEIVENMLGKQGFIDLFSEVDRCKNWLESLDNLEVDKNEENKGRDNKEDIAECNKQ
jgi:hypothetical protein